MQKKHTCIFKHSFLLIAICCMGKPVKAQCFYVGSTPTPHVSFEYYAGGGQSVACSELDQVFYTAAANSNNLPELKIRFLQPDNHSGFRVCGLNITDSVSIKVNDVDYPLTPSTATINSVFTCGTVAGSDVAMFANNYLVGTDATSNESLAYADLLLTTSNVNSITFYSRSGASWGFAGALANCNPVPVTLVSFKATGIGKVVLLQWNTSSEINTNYFEVESSTNAMHWQSIGHQNAAGNSNSLLQYSFQHTQPAEGNNYYRLKQVDKDGQYNYSAVQAIRINAKYYTVSPNPFSDRFQIAGTNIRCVTIVNAAGKELLRQYFYSGNSITVDMHPYPDGIYFVRITDADGNSSVQKLVKL